MLSRTIFEALLTIKQLARQQFAMFWTFELYCHLVSRYFWFYKFTSKNLRRILITPKTIYEKGLLQQTVYVQGPVSFLGWQFAFQAKLSSSCELASHQFSRYVHCLPEVLLAMRKEKAKNQINFSFISMCFCGYRGQRYPYSHGV